MIRNNLIMNKKTKNEKDNHAKCRQLKQSNGEKYPRFSKDTKVVLNAKIN